MSNGGFVVVSYILTWAALGFYAFRLITRRRAMERLWKERMG